MQQHLLLLRQQKNDAHRVEEDKTGHDVELVEEVVLGTIRTFPAFILEPEKQWAYLLRMQPLTRKKEEREH